MKPQCINRKKSNKTKITCHCYVLLGDGLLGVATKEDTGKQLIIGPRETESHAKGGSHGKRTKAVAQPSKWRVEREDLPQVLF